MGNERNNYRYVLRSMFNKKTTNKLNMNLPLRASTEKTVTLRLKIVTDAVVRKEGHTGNLLEHVRIYH